MSRLYPRILAFCLVLVLLPSVLSPAAESAGGFDPEACAAHAEANYLNNAYGLCAQFASMCLYYGGLTCAYNSSGKPYVSCAALRDSLIAGGISEYQVTLGDNGTAYQADNVITRGDVIFWQCDNLAVHGHTIYPHAAICQGEGKNGQLIYCARNNSAIDHTLTRIKCYGCGKVCQTIVGFHPGAERGSFRFRVYKDGAAWEDSPALAGAYLQRADSGAVYPLGQSRGERDLYLTVPGLEAGEYALWINRGDGIFTQAGPYLLEEESAAETLEFITLRFRGNGSAGGAPPNGIYLKGQTFTLPRREAIVREGYDLAGWGLSPAGPPRYAPGQEFTVTESCTLYAIWIQRAAPHTDLLRNSNPPAPDLTAEDTGER